MESYGGSSIRSLNQTRGLEEAESPFIQFVVYAQPMVFIKELAKNPDDPSAAFGRMLIVKPPQVIKDLEECHKTVLSHEISVPQVLNEIQESHENKGTIYRFEVAAKQFVYEIDRVMKAQMRANKEDSEYCGILVKDIQKIIRVSAIFCALRTVAETLIEEPSTSGNSEREKISELEGRILEAVKNEDFIMAHELKDERDALYNSLSPSSSSVSRRFFIQKIDVESAQIYVKHCSSVGIQITKAAKEMQRSFGSPSKTVKKPRKTHYWADDLDNVNKPFDFIMGHSPKVIKLFDNSVDGEVLVKTVQTKRCYPQASSARERGADVERNLVLYFLKILKEHGIVTRISEDKKKASLPQTGDDLTQEAEDKFHALMQKHPEFRPFK